MYVHKKREIKNLKKEETRKWGKKARACVYIYICVCIYILYLNNVSKKISSIRAISSIYCRKKKEKEN